MYSTNHVLTQFVFTTSEPELDHYHQNVRVASGVAK